ncbi:DNA gyrase inhibitor YacG [Undibacterium sp. Ji22W]|uniref:DNA gyrase inhibitor YacG n=1 Tax=Undibacterium sp. Ji22W TaxID=3413038 RepID=UPI003BF15263
MATVVSCPTCAAKVVWSPESAFRPFCSDRCKQIDLGAWAEEKYTIPAVNLPEDPDNPDLGPAND